MKKFIDIVVSCCVLLLIVLFFPFVALAIKLNSRGPIFVKLKRVSNGKIINVYKFRTMINNAHLAKEHIRHLNERNDGPFFKTRNDPRMTKVGRHLRRFRIDELPQLINVLKGELSLVGPRPHEPEEIEKYPLQYKYLAMCKAGATGLSQVNGASSLPFVKELEFDDYYIKNQSLLLDLKILAKTIIILFTDRNAV